MRRVTAERLARLMAEELARDCWGDIDPHWFKMVADGSAHDPYNHCRESASELGQVLGRVAERLNAGEGGA